MFYVACLECVVWVALSWFVGIGWFVWGAGLATGTFCV